MALSAKAEIKQFDHSHESFTRVLKQNTSQKDEQTWVNYAHLNTFNKDQKLAFFDQCL